MNISKKWIFKFKNWTFKNSKIVFFSIEPLFSDKARVIFQKTAEVSEKRSKFQRWTFSKSETILYLIQKHSTSYFGCSLNPTFGGVAFEEIQKFQKKTVKMTTKAFT